MRLNKTVKSLASIAVFALALGLSSCSPVQALTLSGCRRNMEQYNKRRVPH